MKGMVLPYFKTPHKGSVVKMVWGWCMTAVDGLRILEVVPSTDGILVYEKVVEGHLAG